AKANQTITFNALANKTFGNPDFNVSATASSGLSVSFSATGIVRSLATRFISLVRALARSQPHKPAVRITTQRPTCRRLSRSPKPIRVTALLSSVNPSSFGQSVTFTATSGAGTPTGTAQFKDNGANLGASSALNAGGVATFST